ncbi:hypothetical protein [Streptococcus oralis]|uniref:Uncharacterized protein n=1 Tax=Streptococcus oralis subsp. tigurinus TaxID=1077464 RepID=A0A1X1GF07_STROR|nr:hypothetical protein [Streptococcus oralis]ORO45419.1 hypothetical protein B7725_06010 [Streptococcus oralis subsp. tigurinus]
MIKVPVANLGLFEQLDRIVVAFFRKQQSSSPYDLNVSITQEHLDQKKQELEPLGYQAVQIPLGMALDNIIQQPYYKNLIIGGLAPDEIMVSKEELIPLKDIVDSFCIMYAAANNRLENSKAYELMKDKTVYFIGKLLTDDLKSGDEISYMGIERKSADGTSYEAVKCFLTKESAEQYNDSKKPISSANLAYLQAFWGKPVIIEPHRNYWIEFK